MKIYLAAPFFSKEQLDMVKRLEEAFDLAELDYFSPRSEGVLIKMSPKEKEQKMKEIFNSNVDNIFNCQIMIAVIDNWDTGTVWELGLAYAFNKRIFTISDNDYGLNVMVRQSVDTHNTNIDNLITNIIEYKNAKPLTIFEELTKDVT